MAQGTNSISDEQQYVRTEDYLNDKLQVVADLDSLDSLLKSSKQQQNLLKEQVLYENSSD